jgi:DNA repair protein RecN (Recombination protein N)
MLQSLSVKNYALINELEINFSGGLVIITGETGAGKSILLGALSLILGQRADVQALRDKTRKCIIEAVFNIKEYDLADFFKENELDHEDITSIRREVNPEGKSRAFINDTPVSLTVLKELVSKLIDIHSQHETLMLNNKSFQLGIIDSYAGNEILLKDFKKDFKSFKLLEAELLDLQSKEEQSKKEEDYFKFQFNELEEANLVAGEQEKMEQELEILNNSESIKQSLSKATTTLNGGEENLLNSFKEIRGIFSGLAKYNETMQALNERLSSVYVELKDIADETEDAEGKIFHDPEKIELLNSKLDNIYRLQQKHNVKTIEELIAIKDSFSDKLLDISSLEDKINALRKKTDAMQQKLMSNALKLSANRKKSFKKLETDILSLLEQLAMPNAQFRIEHIVSETFSAEGIDEIRFLFSANKGSDFKELHKVASGGELSRLMLAIKSLMAKLSNLPTIIFDEIDTGISGNIAAKAAGIMQKMASSMQVIAITHLPQIASTEAQHLFVYKEETGNKTFTHIKNLDKDERVQEIAKMLSSGDPSEAAIKNARELLNV